MAEATVFLDANAILYALDETAHQNNETVRIIRKLLEQGTTLCTSHRVIEEVLHVVRKIMAEDVTLAEVVKEIQKIPGLVLVEPSATLSFAKRYAKLCDDLNLGVNDALLLQIMIDADIPLLLSYDKKFIKKASEIGIHSVPTIK